MDPHLISLARAVKRRTRARYPTLWLFTDADRAADPLPAIAKLPRGLAGVVFRHDGAADRAVLARRVAILCRARRLVLVIAGDWRLAAACHAGLHRRGGRRAREASAAPLITASAHGRADLVRAAQAGADIVFLSPAFATGSHRGAVPLGAVRWAALARTAPRPMAAFALGGITGRAQRRLGSICAGIGAIGALLDSDRGDDRR